MSTIDPKVVVVDPADIAAAAEIIRAKYEPFSQAGVALAEAWAACITKAFSHLNFEQGQGKS